MNEFEEVPQPEYESDPDSLNMLYAAAWLLVIQAVLKLLTVPAKATNIQLLNQQQAVINEVTMIFTKLRQDTVKTVPPLITESYTEGVKYSRKALATEKSKGEKLTPNNQKRIEKIITDTQSDLLKATHNTEANVKQLVRSTVAKEMQSTNGRIVKVSNLSEKIEKSLKKNMLMKGIEDANKAIIDKAGRTWKLKTYSAMVAKTKMNTAYMQAIRDEAEADGADLAIISTKPDTVDACKNYEGMIISLNGKTAGYYTYDELKASKNIFHPNCGHFCRPVSSEAMIPPAYIKKHKQLMDKLNS
ncbi:phage minor capsid protein [Priestia aryabhattai]|uniref:phage minor capsid protein n=1 Tax=Priestia aryabhattai TaxID=412384 RepID=UPI003D2B31F6